MNVRPPMTSAPGAQKEGGNHKTKWHPPEQNALEVFAHETTLDGSKIYRINSRPTKPGHSMLE